MTNKTYKAKGSATRAINKAVANGEYKAGELETRKVEGGFQIILIGANGPMEFSDEEILTRWNELTDPELEIITDGSITRINWFIFPKETPLCTVLGWFNRECPEGYEALQNRVREAAAGPMEFSDEEIEAIYKEYVEKTPELIGEDCCTTQKWFIFDEGINVSVLLKWFDNEYSEGLNALYDKAVNAVAEETPQKPAKTAELPENQKAALNALLGVKHLMSLTDGERAEVWFPFKAIYDSNNPCNLPKRSMGGIMRGLINRGFIKFVTDGKEYIGKKAVAVCLTYDGIAALSA
jgi:hypothetical protein